MPSTHYHQTLANWAGFEKLLTAQSGLGAPATPPAPRPSPISSSGEVQCSHDLRGGLLDNLRRRCIIFPNDAFLAQRIKTP